MQANKRKQSPTVSQSQATITQQETTMPENTSDDEFLPEIDLTELTEQHGNVATAMLREVCNSIARNTESS